MSKPAAAVDDLEFRIDNAALLLHSGSTSEIRAAAWATLQQLHKLRTPERVREMEEAQGIARGSNAE